MRSLASPSPKSHACTIRCAAWKVFVHGAVQMSVSAVGILRLGTLSSDLSSQAKLWSNSHSRSKIMDSKRSRLGTVLQLIIYLQHVTLQFPSVTDLDFPWKTSFALQANKAKPSCLVIGWTLNNYRCHAGKRWSPQKTYSSVSAAERSHHGCSARSG